jgi:energy coupling factor transporter S component ThiW
MIDANSRHRKVVLSALFASVGVLLSGLSIPIGPTRCFPIQHAVNVLAGILLGPWWAAGAAFITSTLRLATGTGTLFAYPGSIPGALAVGLAASVFKRKRMYAALAEPFGTSLVGAGLSAAVIAPAVHSKATFSMLVWPFFASSASGAFLGILVLSVLDRFSRKYTAGGCGQKPRNGYFPFR